MTREATIKDLLTARGFTLGDTVIPSCKIVTGPSGEVYGPMTANECAARFLDGEDSPENLGTALCTPRSECAAKPSNQVADVEGAAVLPSTRGARFSPGNEKAHR